MSFLCDIASAAGPAAAQQSPLAGTGLDKFFQPMMLVLFVGVMYFFFIRPQSKRAKDHRTFLDSLKRGDKVMTASGMYGSIASIDDAKGIVTLEVSKDTQIKFVKSQISSFQKTTEDSQKKD